MIFLLLFLIKPFFSVFPTCWDNVCLHRNRNSLLSYCWGVCVHPADVQCQQLHAAFWQERQSYLSAEKGKCENTRRLQEQNRIFHQQWNTQDHRDEEGWLRFIHGKDLQQWWSPPERLQLCPGSQRQVFMFSLKSYLGMSWNGKN